MFAVAEELRCFALATNASAYEEDVMARNRAAYVPFVSIVALARVLHVDNPYKSRASNQPIGSSASAPAALPNGDRGILATPAPSQLIDRRQAPTNQNANAAVSPIPMRSLDTPVRSSGKGKTLLSNNLNNLNT